MSGQRTALRPISWLRSAATYLHHNGPLWWTCPICRDWRREDKAAGWRFSWYSTTGQPR